MSSQPKSSSGSLPSFSSSSLPPLSSGSLQLTTSGPPPLPVFSHKKSENPGKKVASSGIPNPMPKFTSPPPVIISNSEILEMMQQMRGYMQEQTRTNQALFREVEGLKKKPVEDPSPLQPKNLNFSFSGSPGVHTGDMIPMQGSTTAAEPTHATRITTIQNPGLAAGSSFQFSDYGNTLNPQYNNTNQFTSMQDTGISADVARELQKLKDMISSVPGIVKPIPEVSPSAHKTSRFALHISEVEIPKRFQIPKMKLYDGTTDPEEHVAQYMERMEVNSIPQELKEACLCKGFGSTLTGTALK